MKKYGELCPGLYCHTLQFIDERMYVILPKATDSADDSGKIDAVVIDPHEEEGLFELIEEGARVVIILTHEHFDHISGINWFREHFDTVVIASDAAKTKLEDKDNGTTRFPFLFILDKETYNFVRENYTFPYRCSVDRGFSGSETLALCGHEFRLVCTPGHSPGGVSIIMDDRFVFSGDNLLGNGQEIKSLEANLKDYEASLDFYESLPGELVVLPGHGEPVGLCEILKSCRTIAGRHK